MPKPPVKSAGISAAHSDTRKVAVKKAAGKGVSPVKTGVAAKKKVTAKKDVLKARSDNSHAHARKPRVYFSEVTLQNILDRMANGEPVLQICSGPDMPTRKALYEWIAADKDVERRYAVALTSKADKFVEETIAIADESENDTYTDSEGEIRTNTEVIQRSKLRIDTRMKYASMIAPKKYGAHQSLDIDLTVKLGDDEMNDRIAALMRKAAGGR